MMMPCGMFWFWAETAAITSVMPMPNRLRAHRLHQDGYFGLMSAEDLHVAHVR